MATRTISTPDPGFTGTRAGVVFRDGRGEVDADNAAALAYFARHGYAVDVPRRRRRRSCVPGQPMRLLATTRPSPQNLCPMMNYGVNQLISVVALKNT